MSADKSYPEQRAVLRLRLQAQRQILLRQAGTASTDHFPRSMTMRLLTQRHNPGVVIVTEILPFLLRYLLRHSGFIS